MTIVNNYGHKLMALSRTIPAGEFKAHCLKLMDEIGATGEELIITKRGKPVAKLVPLKGRRRMEDVFGFMEGTAEIRGDIVAPLGVEWEADKN